MAVRQGLRDGSVALASTLLLAACSSAATSPTTTPPPGSATSAPSSASATAFDFPVGLADVGDCFDYTYADGVKSVWRYEGSPVDCTTPHTAVTVAIWPAPQVLELPAAGALPKAEQDAFEAQTTADRDRCTAEAEAYLGSTRPSSLGTNLLFGQDAAGVIHARCDIIRTSVAGTKLLPLPAQAEGVLAGSGWKAFAQCLTRGGKPVACKQGRLVIGVEGQLNPERTQGAFPGVPEAQRLVIAECKGYTGARYPKTPKAWDGGGYYACLRSWSP